MLGVAVAQACRHQSVAVVVDDHRAEDNLVAAVHVDVGNVEVVEAVAKPGRRGVVAVPAPALGQLVGLGIDVEGTGFVARVATAAQEYRGVAPVQVGSAEVVLAGAVARIVTAPHGGIVRLARLEAGQGVGHRRERVALPVPSVRLARQSVQVEQVLRAVVRIFGTRRVVVHVTYFNSTPRGRVDNHVVGTAHDALCPSVAVPVVAYQVPLLVGTCHEVGAEVYPPQPRAVGLVALVQIEVGLVVGGQQVALRVVALHNQLAGAVAVDVGQRHVVQRVARRGGVGTA